MIWRGFVFLGLAVAGLVKFALMGRKQEFFFFFFFFLKKKKNRKGATPRGAPPFQFHCVFPRLYRRTPTRSRRFVAPAPGRGIVTAFIKICPAAHFIHRSAGTAPSGDLQYEDQDQVSAHQPSHYRPAGRRRPMGGALLDPSSRTRNQRQIHGRRHLCHGKGAPALFPAAGGSEETGQGPGHPVPAVSPGSRCRPAGGPTRNISNTMFPLPPLPFSIRSSAVSPTARGDEAQYGLP